MEDYLPTKEVCRLLGREYQTIMSLAHKYRNVLGLRRKGSKLLWSPEAVQMVRKLAEDRERRFDIRQTMGARRYESGLKELKRLIGEHKRLAQELERVHGELSSNPPSVTAVIYTLPHPDWALSTPVSAVVSPADRGKFRAFLVDLDLWAEGATVKEAVTELRHAILAAYLDPQSVASSLWKALKSLILPKPREDG